MSDDRPQRRSLADRVLGAAAEPSAPKPRKPAQGPDEPAPRTVRWAAVVVAVEAVVLVVLAGYEAVRTATGDAESARSAWGLVVFTLLGAVLLVAAFSYDHPEVGLPMLVPVAVTLYLLATPEARLAFVRSSG